MSNLHTEDYVKFVNGILGNRCHGNDTVCEDKRLVLIDVVARLADVTSQGLLMTHILSREPVVSEELRRVFMHCVAMERPTEVRRTWREKNHALYCIVLIGAFISIFSNQLKAPQG